MAPPAPAMPGGAAGEIAVGMAARLLMISDERIRQLSKAGYIPIPKRGHTTIVGAVQGYIRFLREDARRAARSAAAARTTDARAREIEQRIAMRAADLIARAEAEAAIAVLTDLFDQGLTRAHARAALMGGDRAVIGAVFADFAAQMGKARSDALAFLATGIDEAADA